MTSERKFAIDIKDMRHIEFTCKKCAATVGINPSQPYTNIPMECPACREPWFNQASRVYESLVTLLTSLRVLRELTGESSFETRFTVSEIEALGRASGDKD